MKSALWLAGAIALVFGALAPSRAVSDINFLNILVDRDGQRLTLRAAPESMMSFETLKDERFFIDRNVYESWALDAPFRQTAFLMRTLERNRGAILGPSSEGLPVLSYRFELAVRNIRGEPLHLIEYHSVIGLAPEPGMGLITCEEAGLNHTFPIDRLTDPAVYRQFLADIVFPFEEKTLNAPAEDAFLVDLYYQWPDVAVKKRDFSVFDLFPSLILWDRGPIRKVMVHLGSTYCYLKDGEWRQARSDFLRAHKNAIEDYAEILEIQESGDREAAILALEEYVQKAPDDRKALKKLMDLYMEEFKHAEALDLISRFQPFFAVIREGLPNQKSLAEKAQRRRNWLLGIRGSFDRNPDALVKITAPEDGDLVTGSTDLAFSVAAPDSSPLLQVDCYVDEQLIATLTQPPFEARFTVDGSLGKARLRVTAYFEDKTFQEDEIVVDTLRVDQEERVNLAPILAQVFQSADNGRSTFTAGDFQIVENSRPQEIEHFRKDSAPLRVALLLDTSVSMFGDKLHRTQYAVRSFLSKLSPEDRATVYSFNSRVVKLSDFTNDFDELAPRLMTLSPQGATSLYDGMLIAHDALMGQNGTKVMIIISDGEDSSSATTDIHAANMLKRSPVLVYSIIMPDGPLTSRNSDRFLKEMSRLTGSVHTSVRSLDGLDQKLGQIYEDLKNLYYMDYYSDVPNPDQRDIRVKLRGPGKVRFRALR